MQNSLVNLIEILHLWSFWLRRDPSAQVGSEPGTF